MKRRKPIAHGPIEDGVPIPPARGGSHRRTTDYPWPDMSPGQSVWFMAEMESDAANIRSNARQWTRLNRPHLRTVSRRERVNGVRGVRIWILSAEEDE